MRAVTLVFFALALAGCSAPRPANVVAGEPCWRCRQPIKDARIAGELVASNGLRLKFRTPHCMATWVAQQKADPEGTFYVTDYSTGKWIRAESAHFVSTIVDQTTMARDFVAFADEETAATTARAKQERVEAWPDVLAKGRVEPLGGN